MGHVNDIFTADRLARPARDSPPSATSATRRRATRPEERPADRGRLRGRLGRGRAQRQPGQRGRAARAPRGRRRDLHQTTSDTEASSTSSPARASGRCPERVADALRQVRGAYSLVFLSEDTVIAVRDPMGFRPLALGQARKADLGRLLRDLRLRAHRRRVRARHRAGRDGDHRSQRRAQRAPVRRAGDPPLRLRVGLLRAPRLDHRRALGLPRARAHGAPPGDRARGPGRRGHPGARLGRGGRHRLRARERHPLRPGADALALSWGARSSSRRSRSATSA